MQEILNGANGLLAEGKFGEAQTEFAKYIKACPRDAAGYLGAFLAESGKRDLKEFAEEDDCDLLDGVAKNKNLKLARKFADKDLDGKIETFQMECALRSRNLQEAAKRDREICKVYDYENGVIFRNRKSLSGEITIPEGVVTIGEQAFRGCKAITAVTVPDGVKTIEAGAFMSCRTLRTVKIADSVTEIGNDFCFDCVKLREVELPANLEVVPQKAFWNCASLSRIDLPDTVTEIGNSAFDGCGDLKEIALPKNLKSIGEYAFYGCCDIIELTIPQGVEFIGKKAFAKCKELQKVTMPKSLKKFRKQAFKSLAGMFSKCKFIYT